MKPHGGEYIHGTEPIEQRRLSLLNDLLNEGSLRAMRSAGGETILDVGSDLGQLSRAMARAAGPEGRVIGVERDADQIAEAERLAREAGEEGLVEFRCGNAVDLPLAEVEWGGPGFTARTYAYILCAKGEPMTMAKIFWSGHSQAVRLPKAFRFPREIEEVEVRRQGERLILEPVRPKEWPESFWQAFENLPEGFERPAQQRQDRESLDE